ncbi:MAG TPA: chemotaxis protein CheX [Candidatus Acidoferrales bacterium]|nr:chemotaxis protein CheX [Candidatus Acidoferrales bacterium]
MKMQLIQPFISAADSVLAHALDGPTSIGDLSMEEDGYRPKGFSAQIAVRGEIEGRVILDMDSATAARVASALAGYEIDESEQVVRETLCELANMMIGNAVTLLNDHGYQFKVHPPEVRASGETVRGSADTEAMAIYFDTSCGRIFVNISMRYNVSHRTERDTILR